MYQTYKSEEIKPPKEEKLIPKEIRGEECKSTDCKPKKSGSLFGNMENEDILILGLLLILFFEDCKDNMLIIILAALLFIKD